MFFSLMHIFIPVERLVASSANALFVRRRHSVSANTSHHLDSQIFTISWGGSRSFLGHSRSPVRFHLTAFVWQYLSLVSLLWTHFITNTKFTRLLSLKSNFRSSMMMKMSSRKRNSTVPTWLKMRAPDKIRSLLLLVEKFLPIISFTLERTLITELVHSMSRERFPQVPRWPWQLSRSLNKYYWQNIFTSHAFSEPWKNFW